MARSSSSKWADAKGGRGKKIAAGIRGFIRHASSFVIAGTWAGRYLSTPGGHPA